MDKNTLILFTSDNGPAPNAGVDRPFFNSTGGLRGMKTNMWEGGIRVPAIAWWPGQVQAGQRIVAPGYVPDLQPTILQAIGERTPAGDGRSLWPVLHAAAPAAARDHLYWEFCENPSQAVLMDGRYKAIRPKLRAGDLTIELYDLQTDSAETKNLAATRSDLVQRALKLFAQQHVPNKSFPLPGIDQKATQN